MRECRIELPALSCVRAFQEMKATAFYRCLLPGFCLLLIVLSGAAALVFRDGVETRPQASAPFPAKLSARLHEGDLIFRVGTDWQSESVRRANPGEDDDPYTHVGLLIGSPQHWQVLHSTPAEKPGRADGVVVDDLDFFAAPERARGIALYRVKASETERRAAVRFASSRLSAPFRLVDDDTEGHYCTTFIWRAWREAGVDLRVRFERVSVLFDSAHYLFPPALRRSSALERLYESPGT